jgi:hypothetical protein
MLLHGEYLFDCVSPRSRTFVQCADFEEDGTGALETTAILRRAYVRVFKCALKLAKDVKARDGFSVRHFAAVMTLRIL